MGLRLHLLTPPPSPPARFPSLNANAASIAFVVRGDKSGVSQVTSKYLASLANVNGQPSGPSTTFPFSVATTGNNYFTSNTVSGFTTGSSASLVFANSSQAVITYISQNVFSLGYSDASTALTFGLSEAAILNRAGVFITSQNANLAARAEPMQAEMLAWPHLSHTRPRPHQPAAELAEQRADSVPRRLDGHQPVPQQQRVLRCFAVRLVDAGQLLPDCHPVICHRPYLDPALHHRLQRRECRLPARLPAVCLLTGGAVRRGGKGLGPN